MVPSPDPTSTTLTEPGTKTVTPRVDIAPYRTVIPAPGTPFAAWSYEPWSSGDILGAFPGIIGEMDYADGKTGVVYRGYLEYISGIFGIYPRVSSVCRLCRV